MEPTSSISKMFEIIRNEASVSSYSTEQLKEILYVIQHENLTRLRDYEGNSLLRYWQGIIKPIVNRVDMEKIIRLEETLIREIRDRGEIPPAKKFS